MKLLSWIATTLSIIGIVLNSYLIIWCWPVWIASNVLWIIWSVKKKEWSQLILWNVFFLTNIYGWYQWSINL
jgi:nicotinamide mononucleotide transporter